jgi:DNA-binding transcriptional LysR family regulator
LHFDSSLVINKRKIPHIVRCRFRLSAAAESLQKSTVQMAKLQWDDLRYILAVASHGSLAGAARSLGVNHTTVLRRVDLFEKQLGLRLFERLPTGYVLTAGGEELAAAARNIDEAVTTLERRLAGQDLRLTGTVRVTTTDTLMGSILPEILAGFRQSHPGIQVEITVSNLMLNLTRRDADVAIRPIKNPPPTLVGRRVARIAFAIYGSPRYLERHGAKELGKHLWVGPDDSLADTSTAHWMRAKLPESEIVLRADSLLALRQAAQAGLGLAPLPCYLGDTAPDLRCVHRPIPEMETALWVLTHEDLRHTARIRAFTEFAANAFQRLRPLLEGVQARPRGSKMTLRACDEGLPKD